MSGIKPPDGKGAGSVAGGGGVAGGGEATAPEPAGTSFRDALEQAGAAAQGASAEQAAGQATAAARPDAMAELAQAVRSGALQPDQAVAQLLDRAVAGIGSKLSEAQRLELAAVLREALDNDPALAELRKAIR